MAANNNQSIVSRVLFICTLNPDYNRPKTNELPHVPFVHISEVGRQKHMECLGLVLTNSIEIFQKYRLFNPLKLSFFGNFSFIFFVSK